MDKKSSFREKLYSEKREKQVGSNFNAIKDYKATMSILNSVKSSRPELYDQERHRLCCPTAAAVKLSDTKPCDVCMDRSHCSHKKEHEFWRHVAKHQAICVTDPYKTNGRLDRRIGELIFHLDGLPGGMLDADFIDLMKQQKLLETDFINTISRLVVVVRRTKNSPIVLQFESLIHYQKRRHYLSFCNVAT